MDAPAAERWLLVRGTGEHPLPARVRPESLSAHSSTRRPTIQRGDLAVCYASAWQAIFAVVDVVSDPEYHPGRERWGWRIGIRPRLVLDDLREAVPVEAAGVMPRSLGRHSYVRLTVAQFCAAEEAIAEAARLRHRRAGASPEAIRPAGEAA